MLEDKIQDHTVQMDGDDKNSTHQQNGLQQEGPLKKVKLAVKVSEVREEALGIKSYELVADSGADLPPFTAGAHIEVHLGEGMIRSYSLCSNPADRSRYRIAVLREEDGRGGSKAMHDDVEVGDELTISAPLNHFPLAGREARAHLLLAGGIGVTPMIAMIAELEAKGSRWSMHYLTRSAERTAFRKELKPYVEAGKVHIHHDEGDPAKGPGLPALLSDFEIGTHLYYCGPTGFMTACAASVEAWPPHAIHREFFSAPENEFSNADNVPFEIKVKSSGEVLTVTANQSIVDVLRSAGCDVETDCNEGYCGTCITRYVAGEPEHRDTVLSEKERKSYVMVCCGRAKGGVLELDV